jgi:hypothetical protein
MKQRREFQTGVRFFRRFKLRLIVTDRRQALFLCLSSTWIVMRTAANSAHLRDQRAKQNSPFHIKVMKK